MLLTMKIYCISLNVFWISIFFASAVRKDICEQCVKIEECPSFAHLNKHEQQVWLEQVPCEGQQAIEATTVYGFSPVAKGDYVCCPKSNIWSNSNDNDGHSSLNESNIKREAKPIEATPDNQDSLESSQQSPINQNIHANSDYNGNQPSNENAYEQQRQNYPNVYGNPQNRPIGQNFYGQNNPTYGQYPNYPQYPNTGNVWNDPRQSGIMTVNPGQPQNTWQNPYNRNPYNNNGNRFSRPNQGDQCAAQISLIPDPKTRCCGQDMSGALRITDVQNLLNIYAPSNHNFRPSYQQPGQTYNQGRPSYSLKDNDNDENAVVDTDLDDRIAGGFETELDQFPWTVLLKGIFRQDNSISVFSCGGSLISRRYVLTAGHCMFEPGAKLVGVNLTLAEYDKRTFPRDCKYDMGKKPKCIDNVLMFAEEVILHPDYDDDLLHNDIALIRLQGYAPYTRYIRPICLPSIDIDIDDLTNLPLAVAGWGRNGNYVSDIKQSTVVHLVPHDQCKMSYPNLSNSHLCAAGRTGQDTCKGDSGGPLMMMFGGSYYVIGVVSGKRADSPCGTSVPSLYTNVYYYVRWIRSNIRS